LVWINKDKRQRNMDKGKGVFYPQTKPFFFMDGFYQLSCFIDQHSNPVTLFNRLVLNIKYNSGCHSS